MKSQTLHETECGASRSNGYALLDRKLSAPLDMLLTTEHNWCRWHQTNNNSTTLIKAPETMGNLAVPS